MGATTTADTAFAANGLMSTIVADQIVVTDVHRVVVNYSSMAAVLAVVAIHHPSFSYQLQKFTSTDNILKVLLRRLNLTTTSLTSTSLFTFLVLSTHFCIITITRWKVK